MCNLYSITTNQAAIIALFRVVNRYVGNLAPIPGVFPDYRALIVRNGPEGHELATARWGIPLARDVALAIRAKIKETTGLNASAGISYNKFLAKLASDYRKPNGQYVITPEMGPAFVEALPVGKFHSIGPATSAKMNSLGLHNGLDMRNQTIEFMQSSFGKAGAPDSRLQLRSFPAME